MTVLETAIMTLFNNDSGQGGYYDDIGGRLYNTEAPENATFPYAVFYSISRVPDYSFTDSDPHSEEVFLIQFNTYSKDASKLVINGYEKNLNALFDWSSLTITGYSLEKMQRNYQRTIKVDDMWQNIVTYIVKIDNNT